MDLPKKSIAADIDGDGKDEIITAVFRGEDDTIFLKYAGTDGSLQTKNLGTFYFMADFGSRAWLHDEFFMRISLPETLTMTVRAILPSPV